MEEKKRKGEGLGRSGRGEGGGGVTVLRCLWGRFGLRILACGIWNNRVAGC